MMSRDTFKPGLFDIGLNYEKKLGDYLSISDKQWSHFFKSAPIYLKSATRNLHAVRLFHMDSGRTKARLMLEELVKEYPDDLNILADLIYVYQKVGRERDANSYKEKLGELKNSPLVKAKSILSQADALNYDIVDEHNRKPNVLLKDAWRQLDREDKHSEQISKAIDLIVDAYNVVNAIPQEAYDKTIDAKEIAIDKFEKGITMLKELKRPREEIFVWKHNLANTRGKLENWRCQRGDDWNDRSENCIKALETHLDVIENLSPIEDLEGPLKIYVARSYIFFAQLYMSRKESWGKISVPERIKRYSRDLDSMYRKALSICPEDQTILQRSGRYKYNKEQYFKAIEHYDKSIRLVPDIDINWFSYSIRGDAYLKIAKRKKLNKVPFNMYLELAYKDMKECIKSQCSAHSMLSIASICFLRAMPDNEEGVSFSCKHIDFIYEALETIHEMFNKRVIIKYGETYSQLGIYYPYVGEYRKAIESLKTALEMKKWSKKSRRDFLNLFRCFVAFYKRENNRNLLTEFRYMLKEAKKRHLNEWVTNAMNIMCKYDHKMLIDLAQNMIEWDVRGSADLINEALALYKSFYMHRPESIELCRYLGEQFERKLEERKGDESDIIGSMEIQKSHSTENFPYDFFVSHSENDKDWVNCMLLPQLEEFDEEIKFKGFIPSRDFVPGENLIKSIQKGIQQSCKLLIVLTPNYLKDNWQRYVSESMIFSFIKTKVKEKTIIPIILEECNIPDELKTFTPIFFIEKSDWGRLRSSLTINMDSETSRERRMSILTTCDIDEDQGIFSVK